MTNVHAAANMKPTIILDRGPLAVHMVSEYYTKESETQKNFYRICSVNKSDMVFSPKIHIPDEPLSIPVGMPNWFSNTNWLEGTKTIDRWTLDTRITRDDGKIISCKQNVATVHLKGNFFFGSCAPNSYCCYVYDRSTDKFYRWHHEKSDGWLEETAYGTKIDTSETRCTEISLEPAPYEKEIKKTT